MRKTKYNLDTIEYIVIWILFAIIVVLDGCLVWVVLSNYIDDVNSKFSSQSVIYQDYSAGFVKPDLLAISITQKSESDVPYDDFIVEICDRYDFDPDLIRSIIWTESSFDPNAINYNGTCVGLMQVSKKWHTTRARNLGVEDLMDPYGNILTGVDLLSELRSQNSDLNWMLAAYNCSFAVANRNYESGIVGPYSELVQSRYQYLKEGGKIDGVQR